MAKKSLIDLPKPNIGREKARETYTYTYSIVVAHTAHTAHTVFIAFKAHVMVYILL